MKPTASAMSNPRQEGRWAWRNGQPVEACPYTATLECFQWYYGWHELAVLNEQLNQKADASPALNNTVND